MVNITYLLTAAIAGFGCADARTWKRPEKSPISHNNSIRYASPRELGATTGSVVLATMIRDPRPTLSVAPDYSASKADWSRSCISGGVLLSNTSGWPRRPPFVRGTYNATDTATSAGPTASNFSPTNGTDQVKELRDIAIKVKDLATRFLCHHGDKICGTTGFTMGGWFTLNVGGVVRLSVSDDNSEIFIIVQGGSEQSSNSTKGDDHQQGGSDPIEDAESDVKKGYYTFETIVYTVMTFLAVAQLIQLLRQVPEGCRTIRGAFPDRWAIVQQVRAMLFM